MAVRPDGKALRFALSGGAWTADADIVDRLTQLTSGATVTGWRYAVASDSSFEDYDASGLLLRITFANGLVQQFSHSDGTGGIQYAATPHASGYQAPACVRPAGFSVPSTAGVLVCVSDAQGRQLNLGYDASNRIDRFADPSGQITQYAFDANNNLASVTHPDGAVRTYSRFFSPPGTPAAARALPPEVAGQSLRSFQVLKPFEVQSGTVAPAFGQFGLGTQFRSPTQLGELLGRGLLKEIKP